MTLRNLVLALPLCLSLACGGGLSDDTKITDTSDAERQELCDDVGTFDAVMCEGSSLARDASTAATCKMQLDAFAGLSNCDLTAGDFRDIAGDNFCDNATNALARSLACALGSLGTPTE